VYIEPDDDIYVDHNGRLTERQWIGDQEVVIHYDDIPESDITEVDGIRVTTALRTVIDLAAAITPAELRSMVEDCLARGLFTIPEALARVEQPDLRDHPGAPLVPGAVTR
jgi:hypothetical protein